MVYIHPVSHYASLQVARRLDHVQMLEVPMESVENLNQAVETPSPFPTGLIVTPFPLLPRSDQAFALAALDLRQVLADRLCIPISSFEPSDSAGRLPLHMQQPMMWSNPLNGFWTYTESLARTG